MPGILELAATDPDLAAQKLYQWELEVKGNKEDLTPLDVVELKRFVIEVPKLLTLVLDERYMADIFEMYYPDLLLAAMIAKNKLDNVEFQGIDPESGFGASLIRPEHVGLTTWSKTYSSTGWTDHIGSSSSPVTIHEDIGAMAIIGLIELREPIASAYQVYINSRPKTVQYIEYQLRKSDLYFAQFAKVYIVKGKQRLNTRVKVDATGTSELALFGIVFARAEYLRQESPTTG